MWDGHFTRSSKSGGMRDVEVHGTVHRSAGFFLLGPWGPDWGGLWPPGLIFPHLCSTAVIEPNEKENKQQFL